MNDILEFIDELKELKLMYMTGDLREFDFDNKIAHYERLIAQFEAAMTEDFFQPVYSPLEEV